eukprot:Hpha_TRINITY_DN10867_c0_g1::TRINITY_DN10867_c0_g1_i2::g.23492::m.23492
MSAAADGNKESAEALRARVRTLRDEMDRQHADMQARIQRGRELLDRANSSEVSSLRDALQARSPSPRGDARRTLGGSGLPEPSPAHRIPKHSDPLSTPAKPGRGESHGVGAATTYLPSGTAALPTTEHDDSTTRDDDKLVLALHGLSHGTSDQSVSSIDMSREAHMRHIGDDTVSSLRELPPNPLGAGDGDIAFTQRDAWVAARGSLSPPNLSRTHGVQHPTHYSPVKNPSPLASTAALRPALPRETQVPQPAEKPETKLLQAVEPQLEDNNGVRSLRPTGRAYIPPAPAEQSLDVAGLAHYLEQLRQENADYRERYATFSPPANTMTMLSGMSSHASPEPSIVQISAPPPGARGRKAAPAQERAVHLCGAAAGRGVSFKMKEGVSEEVNLAAMRLQLGIPADAHVQLTDASGRLLRLEYDSVAPEQVLALRVQSSRCKHFRLAGLPDEEFTLYQSHEADTLRKIRDKLKVPPASVLVLMDSEGREFDLVFEDLLDGEMLLFRILHDSTHGARTRLKHRRLSDAKRCREMDSGPSPARRTRDMSPPGGHPTTPLNAVKPPDVIYVTAPGATYVGLTGQYGVCNGRMRGLPQWRSKEGAVLCANSKGGWAVYADGDAVSGDEPTIVSSGSNSKLPHALRQWRSAKTGRWAVDDKIRITVSEPPPPGFCDSIRSFCCGGGA